MLSTYQALQAVCKARCLVASGFCFIHGVDKSNVGKNSKLFQLNFFAAQDGPYTSEPSLALTAERANGEEQRSKNNCCHQSDQCDC